MTPSMPSYHHVIYKDADLLRSQRAEGLRVGHGRMVRSIAARTGKLRGGYTKRPGDKPRLFLKNFT